MDGVRRKEQVPGAKFVRWNHGPCEAAPSAASGDWGDCSHWEIG